MTEVIGAAATSLVFDIGDAIVATGVISDRVSVVAFFIVAVAGAEVDAGDTVTATRRDAGCRTGIAIIVVGVVAFLLAFVGIAITAARSLTVNAGVPIGAVAVIAGLKVRIALAQVEADDAIAATR